MALPAGAAPFTWNGLTADWSVGSNWTPTGPPGVADTATVNAGNAQLNVDTTILGLTQGGGTVSGTGFLTITGPSTWTAGTHNGTGTSQFGSTLGITGATTKSITGGRTLNLNGTTTWSGNTGANNTISMANASIINNTGTFTDANAFNSTISVGNGGATFNNNGTFDKQSATTTAIGTAFNNNGVVNINAGVFLPGGGGTSSGVYNIASDAKLEFRNGNHVLNNVTTSGAGTFQVSTENVGADAVVSLNGGTHTTNFLLSGSTLTGADHTFQGAATWTGGTITGTAAQSTTFGNTLAISGTGTKTISGGRTVNAGDTLWSGNTGNNNVIAIATASVFNSNGTFTDSNAFNSTISVGNGGATFNNNGTFDKQSATTTAIGTAFNNNGVVNINAGVFLPGGGGTSSGVYNIASDAKLEFRNGNHVLNNVTTSGAGTFQVSTENVGADAVVSLNGGTHTTNFLLSGSTLTGTDHTFQGAATWTGGGISGAASTTFDNDVTISGNGLKTLVGGRTVNLQQTTTWSGNTAANGNAIRFWNGATVNNHGTFNDENAFDSFIEHNVGGPHNFNNIGTYNKQADTVTTVDLGVNFNNTGALNINAGTMRVTNAFDNQGVVTVATDATFATTATNLDLQNHGVLQGTGTYDPAGARTVLNIGQVQPGTPISVGELLIAGNYTQDTSGLIEFNLASLIDFDRMDVLGNLALAGTVHVSALGGYNPNDGDTFTIITFDDGVVDPTDLLGTFSRITWSGFRPDVSFSALYFDHAVVLSATASAIPLPASAWLLATGVLSLVGSSRRRRRLHPTDIPLTLR